MTDWRDDHDNNFDGATLLSAILVVVGVVALIYIAMGGGFGV